MATTVSSVWQLNDRQASLVANALRGVIDLARPQQGLASIQWQGAALGDAHVLGVEVAPAGDAPPLEDHYIRIRDLVATYSQTATRPMRVQSYWRVESSDAANAIAAIDLQISVQTSLLDSRPELAASSILPTTQVWRLTDAGHFENIALSIQHSAFSIPPAPGCWLFRFPGNSTSYVEMVHPTDFAETQLAADAQGMLSVTHRLFATRLEKGVILRSRLRGVFLPRENDERLAAECYAAFAAEEPPLTT